ERGRQGRGAIAGARGGSWRHFERGCPPALLAGAVLPEPVLPSHGDQVARLPRARGGERPEIRVGVGSARPRGRAAGRILRNPAGARRGLVIVEALRG